MRNKIENIKARAKEVEYFLKEMRDFFASYEDKSLTELYTVCSSNYLRAVMFVSKIEELKNNLDLLKKQLEIRDLL